jgi:cell division protein FtsI/penicillin-binding protein 2
MVLLSLALLLAAYPAGSLIFSSKNAISSVNRTSQPAPPKVETLKVLDSGSSFRLSADLLPKALFSGDHCTAPLPDGGTIEYALDQDLQERVAKVFHDNRVPYGIFMAIEPKTGKILAMSGYSELEPEWGKRCFTQLYPMASLFKIVTASAALELNKVTPETVFPFRGRLTSENPSYWNVIPGRRSQEMTLSMAMGKSVNPVYGRLASDVVGRDTMMAYVDRFGFNNDLFPGTSIPPSRAIAPQSGRDLMLMGAGLGREVKISPLHAASIMAGIANGGVMPVPGLAREIKNGKGETVYSHKVAQLRTIVAPGTTSQLATMLGQTISTGTSRKAFHDRRGRPKLAAIDIAAKTGSINGTDPAGHYSWFAAYAPVRDPEIALVALVINQAKWRIKASYVGEQALEAFFR